MGTLIAGNRLEQAVAELVARPESPVVTTCYLDVDGAHRPRRADCLAAFHVLGQQAHASAEGGDLARLIAVDEDIAMLEGWIVSNLDRSLTRGLALVACSLESWLRVIELPVPVHDEIVVARRPQILQLAALVATSERFGVALVDRERMRVFEYHLGVLLEFPSLFEGVAPHRERQHGWSVSSAPGRAGDAGTLWAPAGSHVDRREAERAEQHLAMCAAAFAGHLDEHPVDHVLLGGPPPERTRLERHLPERHHSHIAGHVAVRVSAGFDEVLRAVSTAVNEVERSDEEALLARLTGAPWEPETVLGWPAVLGALSAGRVKQLVVGTDRTTRGGARCTSCNALQPPGAVCTTCGAATAPVDDVTEAAVEQAVATGARCHFVAPERIPAAAEGVAATLRY